VERAKERIRTGMIAYRALERVRADPDDKVSRLTLEATSGDLGYALLLKREREDVQNATPEQVDRAAWSTVPDVGLLFWLFRIMVGIGFYLIALFAVAWVLISRRRCAGARWFLWVALFSLPLPWLAAEVGWIVAEVGRQPWAIEGVLPTFLAVSHVGAGSVLFTLVGFVALYSALALADVYLMVRYVRLGPDGALKHGGAEHGAPAPEQA